MSAWLFERKKERDLERYERECVRDKEKKKERRARKCLTSACKRVECVAQKWAWKCVCVWKGEEESAFLCSWSKWNQLHSTSPTFSWIKNKLDQLIRQKDQKEVSHEKEVTRICSKTFPTLKVFWINLISGEAAITITRRSQNKAQQVRPVLGNNRAA